jgi:DNA adenine methylase
MVCEPFLKWPGGKRWVAIWVAAFLKDYLRRRYYEPFLGGGAVFFALHPARSTLTDINPHVISTYTQVRDNLEGVLNLLKKMRVNKRSYCRIRAEHETDPTAQAAQFLFLNRTCFGGMYRLNKHGEFNVPYGGGQRTPEILWERGILAEASAALKS